MLSYCGLLAIGLLGLHPDFGVLKTNSQIRFAHKKMGQLAGAVAMATGKFDAKCPFIFWSSLLSCLRAYTHWHDACAVHLIDSTNCLETQPPLCHAPHSLNSLYW